MSSPAPTGQRETASGTRLRARMTARSPHEVHRAATPLELFFDLVFVVAIAQAASSLHHAVSGADVAHGLIGYLMVFFAIWWAWMNFTWFASAYDSDDVPYRLMVFLQMTGALIIAAGVPAMFDGQRATTVTIGYVVMRSAMVAQWLRAAGADPPRRKTAYRYAIGISTLQLAWLGLLVLPRLSVTAFVFLVCLELLVPMWAERAAPTPWHPHHIAERYGLLTLIVLGESILAAMLAVQSALADGERFAVLASTIIGGLLVVCSMWWIYFDRPVHDLLTSFRKAFVWGYGHYVVFASAAAVGAGLAVNVDLVTGHSTISAVAAGYAVAIPAAVYLCCLWVLHDRPAYRRTRAFGPITAVLILLSPFTGQGVLATGLLLAALVASKLAVKAV
jgi:low temperature requirement protein LtrA